MLKKPIHSAFIKALGNLPPFRRDEKHKWSVTTNFQLLKNFDMTPANRRQMLLETTDLIDRLGGLENAGITHEAWQQVVHLPYMPKDRLEVVLKAREEEAFANFLILKTARDMPPAERLQLIIDTTVLAEPLGGPEAFDIERRHWERVVGLPYMPKDRLENAVAAAERREADPAIIAVLRRAVADKQPIF